MVNRNSRAGAATVDQEEVERFSRHAADWWNPRGAMAPLHKFNPVRVGYIRDQLAAHFKRDPKSLESLDGLRILDIGCGGVGEHGAHGVIWNVRGRPDALLVAVDQVIEDLYLCFVVVYGLEECGGGTALPANKRTAPARARRPAAVTGGLARARRAGGEGWGATKARTGSARREQQQERKTVTGRTKSAAGGGQAVEQQPDAV